MLSDKSVQEFKRIFKEEYGKELTDSEARDSAESLIGFFQLLIKVDQRNKQKEHEDNKKNSRFTSEFAIYFS